MRVRVRHEITHRFEPAARHAIATLRLTPRSHVGQHILRWTLDVSPDCRLMPEEDAFGNTVHTFSVGGPVETITVIAEGDVDTQDTTGVIAGSAERFPPSLFLRQTDMTQPDAAIMKLADAVATKATTPLDRLHGLMVAVHEGTTETAPEADATAIAAGKALAAGEGTAASLTHVFISAARHLKLPARQVSGYAVMADVPAAFREWAEAHVPGIGWVGFDCGKNVCPSDGYVRLAVGLDSLAVAPMLSTGSRAENTAVARDFFQSPKSGQSQQQGQGQRQE
ncbi:transglutaminase [Azorhizobium oxalatiphilum]|uniref:Transglutaminase n=1 Tax=Azorhizobium oxalatiphilum TaxID=980631 RepID=A0A917BYU1_9HYPH|nr:transglutaminase N-terminal domain-containing protein [Azorhizobium oxalatiphilum]GGF62173.1 transglutaminase [Azorhizobium oxalatiphilum]